MTLLRKNIGGWQERIVVALFVSAGFFLTILFFAPLHVYMTNRSDFPCPFPKVFFHFLTIAGSFILLGIPFLAALPYKMHKKAVALISIFSFLFWLQGNILVRDYGLFDGRQINWSAYRVPGFIDLAIWITGIVVAIKKSEALYRTIRSFAIWLIIIQSVSVLYFMTKVPSMPMQGYDFATDDLYNYSSKKNVVVLLLDGFQNDIFREIIDEDSSFIDAFKDFTYFRNAVGGYPSTTGSLGLILTGRYYDNRIPYREFVNNEVLLHSIPKVLKDNGFKVEFYPLYARDVTYACPGLASNCRKAPLFNFTLYQTAKCYEIVLFRHVPGLFKKYCLFDSDKLARILWKEWKSLFFPLKPQVSESFGMGVVAFFKASSGRAMLLDGPDTFKFIHLKGLHPPLEFNERLESVRLPENRQGHKTQAKGILKLVGLFLSRLKEIGGYDNTMVIIIGDHGIDDVVYFDKVYHQCVNSPQYNSLPLVLIKPFESHKEMVVSDAPISLGDLPQTVISSLGIKADFPGDSMFSLSLTENRPRKFFCGKASEGEYFPPMREFVISGLSWKPESWHDTNRVFVAPTEKSYFDYRLIVKKIAALSAER